MPWVSLGTFRTEAENIEFVALLSVAVLLHKLTLKLFEFRTVDFFELSTPGTDKMVMVLMVVLVFVAQGAVSEINRSAQAGFAHELYCPGNGSITYAAVLFSDQVIQLLDRDVLFGIQKSIEDFFSLLCMPKAFISYILKKFFFSTHNSLFLSNFVKSPASFQ